MWIIQTPLGRANVLRPGDRPRSESNGYPENQTSLWRERVEHVLRTYVQGVIWSEPQAVSCSSVTLYPKRSKRCTSRSFTRSGLRRSK